LTVTVNGAFPHAKGYDGVLSWGDFNFTAAERGRAARAKDLKERSGDADFDWRGMLDELAIRLVKAEREGAPAIVLADVVPLPDDEEFWDFEGLQILQRHPTVLFGRPGSGKSYLAMWIAGMLAREGVSVLYADWEYSADDHRKRLERLFRPMPRNLHYIRCDQPLCDDIERIKRLINKHGCGFLVCDSMGPACDKRPEDAEQANGYARAVRQLSVGSLHVAHPPKGSDDDEKKRPKIFGSVFFEAMARSIWWVQAAQQNPKGEIRVGLYHEKFNSGERLKPRAVKIVFDGKTVTRVEKIDVKSVEELANRLPLVDRLKSYLEHGPCTIKRAAEDLDTTPPVLRKLLGQRKDIVVRISKDQIAAPNYESSF